MEYSHAELKNLRVKYAVAMNIQILLLIGVMISIVLMYEVTISHMHLVLSIIFILDATRLVWKGDSTKSIIPIYQQMHTYEKQIKGEAWLEDRKRAIFLQYFLGFFWLILSFAGMGEDNTLKSDFQVAVIIAFVVALVNVVWFLDKKKEYREEDEGGGISNAVKFLAGLTIALLILAFAIIFFQ
ncbi:hypothetical protein CEY16_12950 [Halalkalibacillus sediminis]|uniref:Uncharacterized protein n=1 Tax=Halalkalibacillus sediminis TaxID=2018042 RepID=A0A2I0QQW7_9BACI|nr:hypothetical protein [Halalkalibacillus sediminis]PKR76721.1 hypothetical protein CEY16_12950 [Halalkalibacillus sediminis]